MKLSSFAIEQEVENISVLGETFKENNVTEIYELVCVSGEELEAWKKIEQEIRKLNIWVKSYWSLSPYSFGMELTIRIEQVEGFNIKDHFNGVLRLEA
jgi:hypothetical protein